MNAIDLIRRLHAHRMHADHLLLEEASKLDDEQLRRSFAIGQGSVWRSLRHMFAAEYVWLAALEGDTQAVAPGDVAGSLPGSGEGIATLHELRTQWSSLDERWLAYLRQLSPESLDDSVVRVSTLAGVRRPWTTTRADVLLHVCTHAHYTAAQTINMLRQLGVTPLPDPMLITIARREHPGNM